MFKQILAALVALFAVAAFAAVDINKATQAELEAVKGIGPGIAVKILDERKKGSFRDWNDFVDRVKGVGEGNAAKFSAEGLTVGGAAFKAGAPAATAAKKDDKPSTKAVAPMAAASAMKADAKADAKPMAKDDKKSAADERKAKAEKAAAAKAEKAAAAKAEKAAAAKEAKAAKPVVAKDSKPAKPDAAASAAKK